MEWNEEYLELYQRQILLSDIGIEGQERIFDSSVLVIGAGSIGSSALLYLAASGVGKIGILGDNTLSLADIPSQILYTKKDIGKSKLSLIKTRLKAINPNIELVLYKDSPSLKTLSRVIEDYDVVLDSTDSFAPKFLINESCVRVNKPLIHAGVVDLSVQIMSIQPNVSACYACVYGQPKPLAQAKNAPTCAQNAMIGSVAGIVGCMQATEAIKIICSISNPLYNQLLTLHTRDMRFSVEQLTKNPTCPVCKNLNSS